MINHPSLPASAEGPCCPDCAIIEAAAAVLAGRRARWTLDDGREIAVCPDCGSPIFVDQATCRLCGWV